MTEMLSNVDRSGDCWIWMGRVNNKGYGQISVNGQEWLVHRLAYTLLVGPIRRALIVCHKCDVPRCCRPGHLFLGTRFDNMRDAAEKGRLRRGDTHPQSLLTAKDVLAIRASNKTQKDLGRQYGCTASAIGMVINRKTWRHI